jgi:hypothetical protein
MNRLCNVLLFLSAGILAVLTGAHLTEGFILVPYWRSLVPAEFFAWYAGNTARLDGFFGALTIAATLLSVAAAITTLASGHPRRGPALVAAVLMVAVLSMYFAYFGTANASFAAATIRAEDLSVELARWASLHWLRTGMDLAALVAAFWCLRRN